MQLGKLSCSRLCLLPAAEWTRLVILVLGFISLTELSILSLRARSLYVSYLSLCGNPRNLPLLQLNWLWHSYPFPPFLFSLFIPASKPGFDQPVNWQIYTGHQHICQDNNYSAKDARGQLTRAQPEHSPPQSPYLNQNEPFVWIKLLGGGLGQFMAPPLKPACNLNWMSACVKTLIEWENK